MANLQPADLIESVPDPDAIRARIAQIGRERSFLRSLLRLSKRRERTLSKCAQGEERGQVMRRRKSSGGVRLPLTGCPLARCNNGRPGR